MKLDALCRGVKPSCPRLKSQEKFIDALFRAAGHELSYGESYKRKLFNGDMPFRRDVKALFREYNFQSLTDFFLSEIADDRVPRVVAAFGIPEPGEASKEALCKALACQMGLLIDSDDEDVDDIVALRYQVLKLNPEAESVSLQGMHPLYPGDDVYMRPPSNDMHKVNLNELFEHAWAFDNVGTQTWTGRRLYLSNHAEIRPRAESVYVSIPDTPPNATARVSVRMDSRGFEGRSECQWVMVDKDGSVCFPNRGFFAFAIDVEFRFDS